MKTIRTIAFYAVFTAFYGMGGVLSWCCGREIGAWLRQ